MRQIVITIETIPLLDFFDQLDSIRESQSAAIDSMIPLIPRFFLIFRFLTCGIMESWNRWNHGIVSMVIES